MIYGHIPTISKFFFFFLSYRILHGISNKNEINSVYICMKRKKGLEIILQFDHVGCILGQDWRENIEIMSVFLIHFDFFWLVSTTFTFKNKSIIICMRQVLGPGALGRPRGIGWRGRWEGGIGMGNTCKSMANSCQCMTKTTTIL